MYNPIQVQNGSASAASYSFTADPDTGIYHSNVNELSITTGGTTRLSILNNQVSLSVPIYVSNGSSANPSYSFSSDPDTGVYQSAANEVSFGTNGVRRVTAYNAGLDVVGVVTVPNGSNAAPSYTFGTDTTKGMYSTSTVLGFAIAGNRVMSIDATSLDVNNNKITSLATPTSGTDAANKAYVDNAISSLRVQVIVNQSSHGFPSGTPIYFSGTSWIAARANSNTTISTHIVEIIDANNFYAVNCGNVTTSGLTAGSWYFTSESTAGTLTTTEPVTGYSNPVGQALSTTILMVMPLRAQGV